MNLTRPNRFLKAVLALAALAPGRAAAHASEQGLVLLLPTDVYTGAGVAAVSATVLLLAFLPARAVPRLFGTLALPLPRLVSAQVATSCLSLALLAMLIAAGFAGPRDPLANPLPLAVWTLFWTGLVTLQGVFGNLWAWLNPWSGPLVLLRRATGLRPLARLRFGAWPAIATYVAFAGFLLADPAPSDPGRLALVTALYWLFAFAMALVFGPRWLRRGEGLTLVLTALARVGIFARRGGRLRLGLPGWQIARSRMSPVPALIPILLLATGSFDGLNETFWWLARLGLNPFEFPGRSAIVPQTLVGLALANLALIAVFAACLWLGLQLTRANLSVRSAIVAFAPSLLPIALGYHVAHYLTSFLVDGQYALVALSDPLLTGADLLGLGEFYVSTGFFNTTSSVRVIFLTQAGAVVAGHILAVLVAHALALQLIVPHRRAALSQLPLALFMIAYTLFGLWLLSSPRF